MDAAFDVAVNNFGDTRSGGLAGPMGLFIIVLMSIATVLLIRNMNKRLRRLPDSFPTAREAEVARLEADLARSESTATEVRSESTATEARGTSAPAAEARSTGALAADARSGSAAAAEARAETTPATDARAETARAETSTATEARGEGVAGVQEQAGKLETTATTETLPAEATAAGAQPADKSEAGTAASDVADGAPGSTSDATAPAGGGAAKGDSVRG
ncbi:hypothetical protein [Symbioplanes lichenis]|uniref:hypothetical protein n=1 Tax=Symbioplanes lichenis TaxID=1629072 RepID=UPI00273A550C|nr:hypothetical protein [Actinoplanes lichenis]